jgi:FtsZ-binding cell division protein ZapB
LCFDILQDKNSYIMPKRKTSGSEARAEPTIIQTTTLDSLSAQLQGLTNILAQTQKEVDETKKISSSLAANNVSLRKEVEEAKHTAAEASSSNASLKTQLESHRAWQDRPLSFESKGNEDQHNVQLNQLDFVVAA